MKCPACGREAPAAELAAYGGYCDQCWVDSLQSIVTPMEAHPLPNERSAHTAPPDPPDRRTRTRAERRAREAARKGRG